MGVHPATAHAHAGGEQGVVDGEVDRWLRVGGGGGGGVLLRGRGGRGGFLGMFEAWLQETRPFCASGLVGLSGTTGGLGL